MFIQIGSVPALVISSTDVAKEVFKNHDIVFSGRPALYAAHKLLYGCTDITFSPYGEYWRTIRKLSISELLSPKRVASFRDVREEEVSIVMDFVRKASASMAPINVTEMSCSIINDVICRTAFGRKFGQGGGKLRRILQVTQEMVGGARTADIFPWMSWIHRFDGVDTQLKDSIEELDNFYESIIGEHLEPQRPNPEYEDFVDVLLRLQKDPDQSISFSRYQIKGILTDMFIAGTDTSSATIAWTMTELVRNPAVMKRIQEEMRKILGNKALVEETDLTKLNYLKLVVKETLRLHPPAPLLVPRETTDSCIINGYYIPAKTRVFFNAKAIATDPKFWDDPEEFRPERFITKNIEFKGQDFEMVPFGIGRRSFPAINSALVIIELVLANLLYGLEWELPLGLKKEEINMQEAPGITVHKKFPLFLVAATATA
ncbi:cytochrome P450 71A9-like [Papaver somniferum]|uniref:cytochrome P450 71A9-like n=1 Tax=Papaver somniferum TaxID=3469 RepID=UPI000E6FB17D|nr:cytochrome P450 71A9-like [Papaver somniferum]